MMQVKYAIQFQYDPYSRHIIPARNRSQARVKFGHEFGIRDATKIDPVHMRKVRDCQCKHCGKLFETHEAMPGDENYPAVYCEACAFLVILATPKVSVA